MLGQPIDTLIQAQINAGTYYPTSLYYPARGQEWTIFGPQAFVLTVNGNSQKSWSRYIFPYSITYWTLAGEILYLRTANDLVWQLDAETLIDDYYISTGDCDITVGGDTADYYGYNADTASDPAGFGPYGTITGGALLIGTLTYLVTQEGSDYVELHILGATAAPAQAAFTSISVYDGTNTRTYDSSTATYTTSGNTAIWNW